MSDFTVYIPMLLALVLALTLVTNLIVQVLKSLLYDWIPTNLLAFLVAVLVTAGTGFALWSYFRFAISGWMIAALIALCFVVAFSAMLIQELCPFKVSGDVMIMSAIMYLVPGIPFTTAARDTINGDYAAGSARMLECIVVALAVAVGVGFGMVCFRTLWGGTL